MSGAAPLLAMGAECERPVWCVAGRSPLAVKGFERELPGWY